MRNLASEQPQHDMNIIILSKITFLLSYSMYYKLRIRLISNTSSFIVMSPVFQTYYWNYKCTECFRMQDKNVISASDGVFIRICKWDFQKPSGRTSYQLMGSLEVSLLSLFLHQRWTKKMLIAWKIHISVICQDSKESEAILRKWWSERWAIDHSIDSELLMKMFFFTPQKGPAI